MLLGTRHQAPPVTRHPCPSQLGLPRPAVCPLPALQVLPPFSTDDGCHVGQLAPSPCDTHTHTSQPVLQRSPVAPPSPSPPPRPKAPLPSEAHLERRALEVGGDALRCQVKAQPIAAREAEARGPVAREREQVGQGQGRQLAHRPRVGCTPCTPPQHSMFTPPRLRGTKSHKPPEHLRAPHYASSHPAHAATHLPPSARAAEPRPGLRPRPTCRQWRLLWRPC